MGGWGSVSALHLPSRLPILHRHRSSLPTARAHLLSAVLDTGQSASHIIGKAGGALTVRQPLPLAASQPRWSVGLVLRLHRCQLRGGGTGGAVSRVALVACAGKAARRVGACGIGVAAAGAT